MSTVGRAPASVNTASGPGPGQASKQTTSRLRTLNRALVQAALTSEALPSDADLAETLAVSERTVRQMRLGVLGLTRPELKRWQDAHPRPIQPAPTNECELICATPFAGLWLLVPQIMDSGLARAAEKLRIALPTRVPAIHIVLTLVAWAALGFERLCHVDDFRHWADMGLALFTGGLPLWSDTTLWRWVHGLTSKSATQFYERTVQHVAGQAGSRGRFSVDEHGVPSFTHLRPGRLGKTRVPARGRSYPAFRWSAPFALDPGRFVGVIVRKARESPRQTVLAGVVELRRLRRRAGVKNPNRVRLIVDRGVYKGSVFEKLMDAPHLSFIAMARATSLNARQGEALPERVFRPSQLAGDDNPNLKIARTQTTITGCHSPLPSVVIREDTPGTKQPWRVLFFKDEPGRHSHAERLDAEYRQRQDPALGFSE